MSGFSLYCASKIFIHHLACALRYEINVNKNGDGIVDNILYSPGTVSTKLNGLPYAPLFVPMPIDAARGALLDCGWFWKTHATFSHWIMNEIIEFANIYIPSRVISFFAVIAAVDK